MSRRTKTKKHNNELYRYKIYNNNGNKFDVYGHYNVEGVRLSKYLSRLSGVFLHQSVTLPQLSIFDTLNDFNRTIEIIWETRVNPV